jgi:hypothetical protein
VKSSPTRTPKDLVERGHLEQVSPITAFQILTVTFPSTPNLDHPIAHTLTPTNPELVDYEIIRKDRAGDVYHDQSGTRQAWGSGYVILRCNVASAVMDIRLSLRRT